MIKQALLTCLVSLPMLLQAQQGGILKDIEPGSPGVLNTDFIPENGLLFFATTTNVSHHGFWRTDGTDTGTYELKAIEMGGQIHNAGGTLFFQASDSLHKGYLWKSDGTSAGTVPLKAFTNGYDHPCVINNSLYFMVWNVVATEYELWTSDGTVAGTVKVHSGFGNYEPAFIYDTFMIAVNNTLYFQGTLNGSESVLWKSDGTATGTVPIIEPHPGKSRPNIIRQIFQVGDAAYFKFQISRDSLELWISDGTSAGTVKVKDFYNPLNGYMCDVNGTLFFSAEGGALGVELWKSDGTGSGTVLVKDIRPEEIEPIRQRTINPGSEPRNLKSVNGKLVFTANASDSSYQLFSSDGTESGTIPLKQLFSGNLRTFDPHLIVADDMLYFFVQSATSGGEIWKSDGTVEGTEFIVELDAGRTEPHSLAHVGNYLVFAARDSTGAIKPYVYDLTSPSSAKLMMGYTLEMIEAAISTGTKSKDRKASIRNGSFAASLNPFKSELNVQVSESKRITVEQIDVNGRIFSRRSHNLLPGGNTLKLSTRSAMSIVKLQWVGGTRQFLQPPLGGNP